MSATETAWYDEFVKVHTIDPSRSVTFEAAARQNGDGTWARAEYSQASGAPWRATIVGTVLAGAVMIFSGSTIGIRT